jgi:hypothetical protein
VTQFQDGVVDPRAVRTLIATGAIEGICIRATELGLAVFFRLSGAEVVLGAHRGNPRVFKSFDGAASVLQQHGIYQFSVDTTGWTPKTLAKKAAN